MRGEQAKTLLLAGFLVALNAYLVHDLFVAGFIAQMGSIEGVYIGLARYLAAHWADGSWFSAWYAGIPLHNAYPPLVPGVVALASWITGASSAHAYHAVTAAFYVLGPVTLFWFALRLSGSRAYGFAAALLYSLFSPSTLLVSAIRGDAGGVFEPRRMQALIQYGEVPHLTALSLLPVALIALDAALRSRKAVQFALAALAFAAVALTNWMGAFALAAAALALLLTRSPVSNWRRWCMAAGIAVFAYLLAVPWLPPSTIATIRANSEHSGTFPWTVRNLAVLCLLLAIAAGAATLFGRWKLEPSLRFGVLFSLFMGTLVLTADWAGVFLVPQPQRYHFELEFGLVLLAVFGMRALLAHSDRRVQLAAAACVLLFCAFQIPTYYAAERRMVRPIDIRTTPEYQLGRWLNDHHFSGRVFVPGSFNIWLLAFTDTPQLGGGFEQAEPNRNLTGLTYQIYTGEGAGAREDDIGELWLRAYGVQAVFVGPDVFHAYRNPRKFSKPFPALWHGANGTLYAVPQRSASLAHVVRPADLVLRVPADGVDVEPLRRYVAALEDTRLPAADFRWRAPDRGVVRTELHRGEVLSIQVSYDRGWHATAAGRPCPLHADALGLMVLEPACNGSCTIELAYDGGTERRAARIAGFSALAAVAAALLASASSRARLGFR